MDDINWKNDRILLTPINLYMEYLQLSYNDFLIKKLEDKYRKHICPVYQLDESMIGGFTVTTEDQVIDGSVQKRLQRMKEVMKL